MQHATRWAGEPAPEWLADMFELDALDRLVWAARAPAGAPRRKLAPWGKPAGGRHVVGRGALVMVSRGAFLSCDIADALRHGGDWHYTRPGADPRDARDAGEWARLADLARARFLLTPAGLVWREQRGADHPAGSPARGLALSCWRGALLTTSGVGMLSSDVVSLLQTRKWPFA